MSCQKNASGQNKATFEGNRWTGAYTSQDFSEGSSRESERVAGFDKWFPEHQEAGTFALTG